MLRNDLSNTVIESSTQDRLWAGFCSPTETHKLTPKQTYKYYNNCQKRPQRFTICSAISSYLPKPLLSDTFQGHLHIFWQAKPSAHQAYRSNLQQSPLSSEEQSKVVTSRQEQHQQWQIAEKPEAEPFPGGSFCVVNFYHLTDVESPQSLIAEHRCWLQDKNILGRIYISHQGINAQLSGPQSDAHAYAEWVRRHQGFEVSPSSKIHLHNKISLGILGTSAMTPVEIRWMINYGLHQRLFATLFGVLPLIYDISIKIVSL